MAGETIEPCVSVPMLNATHPAAVADAGPADDPLEINCRQPCGHDLAFLEQRRESMRRQERDVFVRRWQGTTIFLHRKDGTIERCAPALAGQLLHQGSRTAWIGLELQRRGLGVAECQRGHRRRLEQTQGHGRIRHPSIKRWHHDALCTCRLDTERTCRCGNERVEHELTTVDARAGFELVGHGGDQRLGGIQAIFGRAQCSVSVRVCQAGTTEARMLRNPGDDREYPTVRGCVRALGMELRVTNGYLRLTSNESHPVRRSHAAVYHRH